MPHHHHPAPRPVSGLARHGLFVVAALLSACGGDNPSASPAAAAPAPSPAPATSTSPAPAAPMPPTGPVYYFSDCQTGAAAGCVPGNNANAGTSAAAPKRDISSMDVNALPAGTQLLLARGGAWSNFSLQLYNRNATPTQPLVFDAYSPSWGGTARPWLKSAPTVAFAFEFGAFGSDRAHGGYAVRNLKLDGQQTRYDWSADHRGRAFNVRGWARNVSIDNMEITGFAFAMTSAQTYVEGSGDGSGITEPIISLALRNSHIHRNTAMGFLGEAQGLEISGNTFEANNMAPYRGPNEYISTFNHAIYLSGHGRDAVLRNNTFTNNSVSAENDEGISMCVGGNVTAHGQWTGLLIEDNTITQTLANGSCIGFSITPGGYGTAEFFRSLVLRNNTVVNLGQAISVGVATAPVIEGNRLINLTARGMNGIALGAHVGELGQYGNAIDDGAIVRNNTYCTTNVRNSAGYLNEFLTIAMRNGIPFATNVTQTGNVTRTGADATTGPCAR